jgi:putative nucleotidyltransferase with HDIG domain
MIYYAALLHDIGISDEHIKQEQYIHEMKRHCVLGTDMLKKLPLPEEIVQYVLYHHEYYNGRGPFGLSGEAIPKGAQIISLASAFDDLFGKVNEFNREVILQIHHWLDTNQVLFSQELIDAFRSLVGIERFLLDYFNHETKYELSNKIIVNVEVCYNGDDITKFALCFAAIIDQRSPFTFRHSTGIAELSRKAAVYLEYDSLTQEKMYIAGLLHDIGKLHVSTDILHKNSALTPDERFEINKHTYYTRKILEQIEGFEEITDIAANHHEKLDGTGYPNRLSGEHLTELERVLAVCDVYQALTEERPYRENLPPEQVWRIIDDMTEQLHLDKRLVEKLKLAFG